MLCRLRFVFDQFAFVSSRAVLIATLVSGSTFAALPVFAQDADGKEATPVLVESTIVGDVDPEEASTTQDLTIPLDELKLLARPLTLEELQVEAAAWFFLLKEKVVEISKVEVAIKRENQAIQDSRDAAAAVETAKAKLTEAEAALEEATEGTPEYEAATQQFEEAKAALNEAEQKVKETLESQKEFEEDEDIKEAVQEAEKEEEITKARNILEEARKEREDLTAGSDAYNAATEKIDILDAALIDLESAEEDLKGAIPDSPEFQEASQQVEEARTKVIQAADALVGAGLAPEEAQPETSVESEEAEQELEQVASDLDQTQERATTDADGETDAAEDAGEAAERLEGVDETLEEVAEAEADLKNQLVANVTELQEEQTAITDRFKVILDALEAKGGDATSYRTYIEAVSVIEFDLEDTEGLGVRLVSWLQSEEGGLRWAINIARFVGILIAAWIVAEVLSRIVNRTLSNIGGTSSLFREFVVMVTHRGTVVIGALLALTSLGVSLGPLLAVVGGASFVLAFALQTNLGNFASGLMLMVNKPFDVGDEVKIADYWAYVVSITLSNTKIKDFNGNIITLPNNTVWGGDIVNYTHSDKRRLGFNIYVSFDQDIDQIKDVWFEIAKSHPQVLETPGPTIFPWSSSYEGRIGVGLKAWCETGPYWSIYADLLKLLQKRFKEAGIELAVPTQGIRFSDASLKASMPLTIDCEKDTQLPNNVDL
ncbi:MAG: mechanosensitive ion channel [Cyanobacteria bacterium SID2]|nr:mechanosensitive ion channel [Cyanobacteria bacterium SID2]MBP0003484.1 mechanosensitive ion channel [Cyanobacteria bacterium SBC]